MRVPDHTNDRVSSEKKLLNVPVLVDAFSLPRGLDPHFPGAFENHVHMPIVRFQACDDLARRAKID